MAGLLAFILQIILGMVLKQKKETSKKITGKSNPSQLEISQAYQKLIQDLIKMKAIGLQVNQLAKAIIINLQAEKYASMGIRAYQESQFFLDRILGNFQEKKTFEYPIGTNIIEKIEVEEKKDYIDCYFPFLTNAFKSLTFPSKIFLLRSGKSIYFVDKTIIYDKALDEQFVKINYEEKLINFLEKIQYLCCNYFNSKDSNFRKWYNIITDKFLNERDIKTDFNKYKNELFKDLGTNSKVFFTTACDFVDSEYYGSYNTGFTRDEKFLKLINYSSYNKTNQNLKNLQLYFEQQIYKSKFE